LYARASAAEARESAKRAQDAEEEAVAGEASAKESEAEARAVLDFMQTTILAAARPKGQEGGLGTGVTIRAALEGAEPEIAKSFAGRPRVEAAVRKSIGLTYLFLREPQRAVPHLEKARALRESVLGPDDKDTLETMNDLAMAYQDADRIADAIRLMEETL